MNFLLHRLRYWHLDFMLNLAVLYQKFQIAFESVK